MAPRLENFYADMGDPPTDQHTLDRVDNNRGYEPGNCEWATRAEQVANRRRVAVENFRPAFDEAFADWRLGDFENDERGDILFRLFVHYASKAQAI